MKRKLISIIIANFNGERYLKTCLNSVLKSNYKNFELLIVDDGSTDKSIQILRSFLKRDWRIKLFRNSKNMGAAASRNKAIREARGEIIVFLDNDTEVTGDCLTEFIKILEEKNAGAAQALLLDFEKRDTIQMGGGLLIPYLAWLNPFYQGKKYLDFKNPIEGKKIIAVSAALAVKKEVINKIGYFDIKEAVYTEDLDFCWRVWIAGYNIILAPRAIVYHYTKSVRQRAHMQSSNLQIYYHLSKNSIRSIIKNYEFANVLKYLPFSVTINFVRGLLVLLRRGDSSALLGAFHGFTWNIANLADTLKCRFEVQKTRYFSDRTLFKKVFAEEGPLSLYNDYFRKSKLLW